MRYEMKISETESLMKIKLFISDIVEGIKGKDVLLTMTSQQKSLLLYPYVP